MEQLGDTPELIDGWRSPIRTKIYTAEYDGTYVESKYIWREPLSSGIERKRQLEIINKDYSNVMSAIKRSFDLNCALYKDCEVRILRGQYKGYIAKINNYHLDNYHKEVLFDLDIYYKNDKTQFISKDYYSKGDARRYYSIKELEFLDSEDV